MIGEGGGGQVFREGGREGGREAKGGCDFAVLYEYELVSYLL